MVVQQTRFFYLMMKNYLDPTLLAYQKKMVITLLPMRLGHLISISIHSLGKADTANG
jgi:hypothetical protein